jgi:hypothetical protein
MAAIESLINPSRRSTPSTSTPTISASSAPVSTHSVSSPSLPSHWMVEFRKNSELLCEMKSLTPEERTTLSQLMKNLQIYGVELEGLKEKPVNFSMIRTQVPFYHCHFDGSHKKVVTWYLDSSTPTPKIVIFFIGKHPDDKYHALSKTLIDIVAAKKL